MSLGPEIEADPNLGREIASALRLESVLGVGTTGRVYRATQLGFERTVAVKLLHPFLVQTPSVKARFHREARLMARLVHPGIVRVFDSGELPAITPAEGGQAYLVYEYLEGQTLRQLLTPSPRLEPVRAVSIALALADAMGCAHARQIVHRDLKPENVMSVARDDGDFRYVVLDFGLARALDGDTDPLTRAGAILGTPQYMSPEAARGEPASPESDVYALATILYEMLAGHPPFYEGTPIAILAQQATVEVPPFDSSLDIPSALEAFILTNLAKSQINRCCDATDFACNLLEVTISIGKIPIFVPTENSPKRLVALAATLLKGTRTA